MDGLADLGLVAVDHRRVDVAVAGLEGVAHGLDGVGLVDLEDAEPELGDFRAVGEGDVRDLGRGSQAAPPIRKRPPNRLAPPHDPHKNLYSRFLRKLFANLPKRAYLTLRYQGLRETLYRLVTFPLRLTPLGPRLGLVARVGDPSAPARAWYAPHGRPVAVVIPSYGPASSPSRRRAPLSARRRRPRDRRRRRSAAEEVAKLRASEHVDVVVAGRERGFAANCNRGLRETRPDEDAVLLNSDVIAHRGWLEVLQHAAYERRRRRRHHGRQAPLSRRHDPVRRRRAQPGRAAVVRPSLPLPPRRPPPADVMQPALAVTGACMYITRETLDAVGELDEGYGMAYEDVDYCLRTWESGRRVVYAPAATLTHHESKTRGMTQGKREIDSQQHFWKTWGDWFDRRETREPRRRRAHHLRHAGPRRRRRAPRGLRASQRAARPRPPPRAVDPRRGPAELVRPPCPHPHVRQLRRAARHPRAARRDQGRHVVGDRAPRLGGRPDARRSGLLRAGHRDDLLRQHGRPRQGLRDLPPGVHLPDDVAVGLPLRCSTMPRARRSSHRASTSRAGTNSAPGAQRAARSSASAAATR